MRCREMLKSKIHRAKVTQADLQYVGSITISRDLMDAADLLAGEKVDVVDIDNGHRLSTYVIEGPQYSGIIGINGAAARLVSPGDLIIIIGYAWVPEDEALSMLPRVVFVDADNRMVQLGVNAATAPSDAGLKRGDLVAEYGEHVCLEAGHPASDVKVR